MENVNVRYEAGRCNGLREYIPDTYRPILTGTNFVIKMAEYKSEKRAAKAIEKLAEKLHLRITDKSLKISQKRKKI